MSGDRAHAWADGIEHFADTLARRVGQPSEVASREPGPGCGAMAECADLGAADQESSQALREFLAAAYQGLKAYETMATRSAAAYRRAGESAEAAVWAVTGRAGATENLESNPVPAPPAGPTLVLPFGILQGGR